MNKNFTIIVKVLDYWLKDSYTYKGFKLYMLIQIGNKISLIEKWANNI